MFGKSENVQWAQIKINHLQFDCQQPRADYSVILAPVMSRSGVKPHKPFIEGSVLIRQNEEIPSVLQVKYASLLVQEFVANIDLLFILFLFESFENGNKSGEGLSQLTIDYYKHSLSYFAFTKNPSNSTFYYFDLVHISPLKFALSLTVDNARNSPVGFTYLLSVIKGLVSSLIGVTALPITIGYFEKRSRLYSFNALSHDVTNHLIVQLVRQFYAVLLGADVLGNPYGLIHSVSSGISDLFYEPIQGAVHGPEEFAKGLVSGAQSFIGNVVGGTAASVSLIFGFSGRFLASLSFDEIYIQNRIISKKRATTPLAIISFGLKEYLWGIILGTFGIFIKPVQYGRIENCKGVLKGTAVGLLGIFVRPLVGSIDLITSVFEMFKVLLYPSSKIVPVRPSRVITYAGQILIYSVDEAEINYLYNAHDGKHELIHFGRCKKPKGWICFLTKSRVFVLKLNALKGVKVHWDISLNNITIRPTMTNKGIIFYTGGVCGMKYYCLQMEDNMAFIEMFNSVLDN